MLKSEIRRAMWKHILEFINKKDKSLTIIY